MRLFSCLAVLSPRPRLSYQESVQHQETTNSSPRSISSDFEVKEIHHHHYQHEEQRGEKRNHHHQNEQRQSGILQKSPSPTPLSYNFSISPSAYINDNESSPPQRQREEFTAPAYQSRRRATGSPTSTMSRVSFSGSANDQRRTSGTPSLMKQMGTPTAFQSIDRGQELCSRVYTSENVKIDKKRSSWR